MGRLKTYGQKPMSESILSHQQHFEIPYPHGQEAALAYLRNPAQSLRYVRFIANLQQDVGQTVRANLRVMVPVLGEQLLPFSSQIRLTPNGAELIADTLNHKAWAEVSGLGQYQDQALHYQLSVRVHLWLPSSNKWGVAAFERMVEATSQKALQRVAQDFPAGILRSISAPL